MTALDTLIKNSSSILTVGLEAYSLSSCSLDEQQNVTPFGTTTITSATSTTLNNIELNDPHTNVRNAQSYVESMSDDQLEEFDRLLSEKGLTFEIPGQEKSKTEKIYIKKD